MLSHAHLKKFTKNIQSEIETEIVQLDKSEFCWRMVHSKVTRHIDHAKMHISQLPSLYLIFQDYICCLFHVRLLCNPEPNIRVHQQQDIGLCDYISTVVKKSLELTANCELHSVQE